MKAEQALSEFRVSRPVVSKILRSEPFTVKEWQNLFQIVHFICTYRQTAAFEITDILKNDLTDLVKQTRQKILANEGDRALLNAYVTEWGKFFKLCSWFPLAFLELENFTNPRSVHIGREPKVEQSLFRKSMLDIWCKNVFDDAKEKLLLSVAKLIRGERDGQAFDQQLVIDVRESFVNLDHVEGDRLKIYRENFETAYVSATENFYKENAAEFLARNGVRSYMIYVHAKLMEEEQRSRKYLISSKDDHSVKLVS